jgi:ADP-heptose:LPS heptosyltransferase
MKVRPVIAAGATTLKQLGALLERADLVIANDTGPMHIAVAMKSKVIALFGPTSPYITGPYGEGSYRVISRFDGCTIPCYHVACGDDRCMRAITVQDVMREAEKLLEKDADRQVAG